MLQCALGIGFDLGWVPAETECSDRGNDPLHEFCVNPAFLDRGRCGKAHFCVQEVPFKSHAISCCQGVKEMRMSDFHRGILSSVRMEAKILQGLKQSFSKRFLSPVGIGGSGGLHRNLSPSNVDIRWRVAQE